MVEVRRFVILSIIWILDTVDSLLQFFGVKVFKLTWDRVYNSLSPAEREEAKKPDVAVPFKIFVKGLEQDDRLMLFRRLHMSRVLKNLFSVRVQNAKLLRENPEILQIPIKKPIIIASMPRSGTTFLSRMMGEDPRARAPALWEMAFPFLQRITDNPRDSKLYRNTIMGLQIDTWMRGDKMHKVHVVSPEVPEECVVLTRLSFWQHIDCKRLPSLYEYDAWFVHADKAHHIKVYQYNKTMLQMLTYTHEDKFYLLKGNIHLWALEGLLEVFPDVCLIYIVRPMAQVIASFCSTYDHLFTYYGPVDAGYGKRMLRMFSQQTTRIAKNFAEFQQKPEHENPLFIVDYKDLIKDPLTMIKKIYARFRIEMTDQALKQLQDYIDSHPQNKFGKHEYSLEKYGLTLEDVKRDLKPYEDYMKSIGYHDVI